MDLTHVSADVPEMDSHQLITESQVSRDRVDIPVSHTMKISNLTRV